MKKNKLTIGIYGIADTERLPYPVFTHDHNLCVFKEGKLLHYLHLERLTRRKYDNRLDEMLYDLLKSKGLLDGSVPTIAFTDNVAGRSFYSFKGDIRFEAPLPDNLLPHEETGRLRWLGKEYSGYLVSHELAHLYSCIPFYGDFKDNSLLVHFDGGATKSNFSAWICRNRQLELIEHHWDLKKVTSFFNANPLTFALTNGNIKNQNGVPGKIMGLAAYGSYNEEIEDWLNGHDFFMKYWGKTKHILHEANSRWNLELTAIDSKLPFFQNVVATMHHVFIREIATKLNALQKKTQTEYLYFTGGSALNICLNKKLQSLKLFREIFVPPCTGDSGLSLGAAAFMEKMKTGHIEKVSPYCNNWNLEQEITQIDLQQIATIASKLNEGKVLALCNGSAEAGPRALGNRSIIARPEDKKLAQRISMKIKKREWYRPVAPVMLEKNARRFTGLKTFPIISKYMLTEFDVLPEKIQEIEGVVHVDGTSRIQVLFEEEDNPFLWRLLKVLDEKYGIPALINTSFNIAGEPIVHSKADAIESATKMQLDGLVFNGTLLSL